MAGKQTIKLPVGKLKYIASTAMTQWQKHVQTFF